MIVQSWRIQCRRVIFVYSPSIVDAYIASIAIRIMSDTRDEEKEKDRNKDQISKVCCKTPKIQEITVRYIIIPVIYLIV